MTEPIVFIFFCPTSLSLYSLTHLDYFRTSLGLELIFSFWEAELFPMYLAWLSEGRRVCFCRKRRGCELGKPVELGGAGALVQVEGFSPWPGCGAGRGAGMEARGRV